MMDEEAFKKENPAGTITYVMSEYCQFETPQESINNSRCKPGDRRLHSQLKLNFRQVLLMQGKLPHLVVQWINSVTIGHTRLSLQWLVLIFLTFSYLAGCSNDQQEKNLDLSLPASLDEIQAVTSADEKRQSTFNFGFDLRHGPKEDAKQYLPLLKYLQQVTGYSFPSTPAEQSPGQGPVCGPGARLLPAGFCPVLPVLHPLRGQGLSA